MGRRGNPYDNAKAESFRKTLKVEAVYPVAFETIEDIAAHIPNFIEEVYNKRRLHSALGYLSPDQFEQQMNTRWEKPHHSPIRPEGRNPDYPSSGVEIAGLNTLSDQVIQFTCDTNIGKGRVCNKCQVLSCAIGNDCQDMETPSIRELM